MRHTTAIVIAASVILPVALGVPAAASAGMNNHAASVAQPASKAMYTTYNVKVRKGAGTNYQAVKTLPKGTKVSVSETKSGWSKISSPVAGYIRSDLLTAKKPAFLSDTELPTVDIGMDEGYILCLGGGSACDAWMEGKPVHCVTGTQTYPGTGYGSITWIKKNWGSNCR